jgi:hypothetical protein
MQKSPDYENFKFEISNFQLPADLAQPLPFFSRERLLRSLTTAYTDKARFSNTLNLHEA